MIYIHFNEIDPHNNILNMRLLFHFISDTSSCSIIILPLIVFIVFQIMLSLLSFKVLCTMLMFISSRLCSN